MFNKNLAAHYTTLCQLSFTPPSNVEYELTEYSIVHLSSTLTDTQGFIAIDDKSLTVVFRGTTSADDWLTNFNTEFTKFPLGGNLTLHEGFSTAYLSVHEQILDVIAQHPDKIVNFTGHSLGGALATVSFVALSSVEGIHLGNLYTFGSPRVFEEASALLLNGSYKDVHYRVVNNNDIVCHIPPEFTNYSHWGTLFYIEASGDLLEDTELSWWKTLQSMLEGIVEDISEVGTDSIEDHDIESYIAAFRS